MKLKSVVLGTAIAVAVVGCLYGCLAYASLRTEFRSLGLR
jgi:flagellar motor component MotA